MKADDRADQALHTAKTFPSPWALLEAVGESFGPTEAIVIEQERINLFADATDDHQWIHVDEERSLTGPFGATIAHGYLTLSLFSAFLPRMIKVDRAGMSVNVGLNRVRFLSPVRVGARLVATATLEQAERKDDAVQIILAVTIAAVGEKKPACISEAVIRYYPEGSS